MTTTTTTIFHALLAAGMTFLPSQASTQAVEVDYIWWGAVRHQPVHDAGAVRGHHLFPDPLPGHFRRGPRTHSRISPTLAGNHLDGDPHFYLHRPLRVERGRLHAKASKPPKDAIPIYVVGLQWYWDVRHENGRHEVGDLHVPINAPVQLIMTTPDVIHSYYVPDFRVQRDVMPGKYTTEWFTATKPGKYRIFCNQYCGTKHAEMGGFVYAMRPEEYQAWLSQQGGTAQESIAQDWLAAISAIRVQRLPRRELQRPRRRAWRASTATPCRWKAARSSMPTSNTCATPSSSPLRRSPPGTRTSCPLTRGR